MRNIIIKCPTCGGGNQIETSPNHYKCPYCGNEWESQSSNAQKTDILNVIMTANASREALDFEKAEKMYQQIIAQYPDEDLSDAYWGLFLCEQRCLFEYSQDKHTQFPSFYDIVKSKKISESESLKNARLQALHSGNSNKEHIYATLAKRMMGSKNKYFEIKKAIAPYDVFICFKNSPKISELARGLYYALREDGYRVFYSNETLKKESVGEWEPNIYYGLYSAKVMLVLCANNEELESQWVKNEWSRYKQMATANSQKDIIPILIGDYTADDLPTALKSYQGIVADFNLTATLKARLQKKIRPMDQEEQMKKMMREEFQQLASSQKQINVGPTNLNANARTLAEKFFRQRQYQIAMQQYSLCLSNDVNDYFAQFMCVLCSIDLKKLSKNECYNQIEHALKDAIVSIAQDTNHRYGTLKTLFENLDLFFDATTYMTVLEKGIEYMVSLQYRGDFSNRLTTKLIPEFKKTFREFVDNLKRFNRYREYLDDVLKYCNGREMLEHQQYLEAYNLFSDMTIYDSERMFEYAEVQSREIRYKNAQIALANQDYALAEKEWKLLDDVGYKNAHDYVENIKDIYRTFDYNDAIKAFKAKEYAKSLEILRSLREDCEHYEGKGSGFKNSVELEKAVECQIMEDEYINGIELFNKHQYEKALGIFKKLIKGTELYSPERDGYKNGYKDAKKFIGKCNDAHFEPIYREALALLQLKKYSSAQEKFNTLITSSENKHAPFNLNDTTAAMESGSKDASYKDSKAKSAYCSHMLHDVIPYRGPTFLACIIPLVLAALLIGFGSAPTLVYSSITKGAGIAITVITILAGAGLVFLCFINDHLDYVHIVPFGICLFILLFGALWFSIAPAAMGLKISKYKDLRVLDKYANGKFYLTNDIDCEGNDCYFTIKGTLDGNGYTISNINRHVTSRDSFTEEGKGLFGYDIHFYNIPLFAARDTTIFKNITFENIRITYDSNIDETSKGFLINSLSDDMYMFDVNFINIYIADSYKDGRYYLADASFEYENTHTYRCSQDFYYYPTK